jgi:hypothetical protein
MKGCCRLFLAVAFLFVWFMGGRPERARALSVYGDDESVQSLCTFHVSPSGSDSDPGTELQPFRTIQHAADGAEAGDVICVGEGNYDERVLINRSGVVDQPIAFVGEGQVVTRGFTILADYVRVENFEVTDTPTDWRDGHGIFLQGQGLVIVQNYVHHTYSDGITCYHHEPYCNDSVIRDNVVLYADGTGIQVFGSNNLVEGNDISHSLNALGGDADGIRFFGQGHVIRGNFIHDITNAEAPEAHTDCFQTFDNSQPVTEDILIEQNTCRNVDHQCMMASAVTKQQSSNIIFRNNICDNNGGQALYILQIPYVTVVNNTFLENILYRAVYVEDSHHVTIMNNIFYGAYTHYEVDEDSLQGFTADYNLKYPASSTVWSEPHGIWDVDPQLMDLTSRDVHLQPTSPAIDAGIALHEVSQDLDGVSRPQGLQYDIGAYEYVPAGTTFVDVPLDHPYHDYIEALYRDGYTAGCSIEPMMYCPERILNRAESAVFLERGIHGAQYDPADPAEEVFADVMLEAWYADWVHGLWDDGYTAGCGTNPLIYCPDQEHTRAEGCVFYLRMMYGADYQPGEEAGYFADVDEDEWYARWVDAAWEAGIAEPCETEPDLRYCPEEGLSRAVAAYMMVKAKGVAVP